MADVGRRPTDSFFHLRPIVGPERGPAAIAHSPAKNCQSATGQSWASRRGSGRTDPGNQVGAPRSEVGRDFAMGGLMQRVIQPAGAFDNELLCIMHSAQCWSAGRSGLSGPSCFHRLHGNEAR